jgi:hypothetical protein
VSARAAAAKNAASCVAAEDAAGTVAWVLAGTVAWVLACAGRDGAGLVPPPGVCVVARPQAVRLNAMTAITPAARGTGRNQACMAIAFFMN